MSNSQKKQGNWTTKFGGLIQRFQENAWFKSTYFLVGIFLAAVGVAAFIYDVYRIIDCESYPYFAETLEVPPTEAGLIAQGRLISLISDNEETPFYLRLTWEGGHDAHTLGSCAPKWMNPDTGDCNSSIAASLSEPDEGGDIWMVLRDPVDETFRNERGEYWTSRVAVRFKENDTLINSSGKLCCPYVTVSGWQSFREGPSGTGVSQFVMTRPSAIDTEKQECTMKRINSGKAYL